jgi:DinB superfamily
MIATNSTASALAQQFSRENDEVTRVVEGLSDTQCRQLTSPEGWPAIVLAHHVAEDNVFLADLARVSARGKSRPAITFQALDQMNAHHAAAHANCAKPEVLAMLRQTGDQAAAIVREIPDEQLAQTAEFFAGRGQWTIQQVLEWVFIGHVVEHRSSLEKLR